MNSDANGPPTDTVSVGVIGQSVSSACAILSGGLLYLVAADSESFDRHGIKKNMYAAWAVVLSLSAAIGFRTGNLDHIHICAWIIGSAALLHGFAGLIYPRWFHKFYEDPRNPCERPNSSSPFPTPSFSYPPPERTYHIPAARTNQVRDFFLRRNYSKDIALGSLAVSCLLGASKAQVVGIACGVCALQTAASLKDVTQANTQLFGLSVFASSLYWAALSIWAFSFMD